ncbi:type 1 glutamine amidotransferase domain-containing protein [Inquilinus sp.]|uniref:type 1 glutamine amidotransferase domain-containing protein n=1 Tax=Inquilinus sp. TaxID=1932117 RepID=UPI003784A120
MTERLDGRRIAVLVAHGFEQVEMTEPVKALKRAGARVEIVSPEASQVTGHKHLEKGDSFAVDVPLDQAAPDGYHGLLIPGGVHSPDRLRTDKKALSFVRSFFEAGKPVAAICHGPQLLISAGVVEGCEMTGYKAIQIDLRNAGATVYDREVVVDQGVVTSRSPDDLPAFNTRMIEEFAEGQHGDRMTAL